jgi:hypothetical protein
LWNSCELHQLGIQQATGGHCILYPCV